MVYGLFRALPGARALWPPSPARLHANLTPASGCQDHTLSPSASSALVRSTIRVHRIPPRVRDDHDTPLLMGRDGDEYRIIRIFWKAEYFSERGLTRVSKTNPTRQGKKCWSCDRGGIEAFDRGPDRNICPEGFQNGLDAA